MKARTKDNLNKAFANRKEHLGQLEIPVIGLMMTMPIEFEGYAEPIEEVFNEAEAIAQAEALLDTLFPKLAQELDRALVAALRSSVWAWRDGSRDIYDTGELAGSGRVVVNSDGVSVVYNSPYANIVHNGGYIYPYGNKSARPIYLPGRPWVSSVLYGGGPVPQFDFQGFFKRHTS